MGIVKAICISTQKGTQKQPVPQASFIPDWGIEGDAHAGHWHRQVSLLSADKVEAFRQKGIDIGYGAFGENLVVEGFDFSSLPMGTRFRCGTVLLEMTQIGKECHNHCAIYKAVGDCIMPREGVFAKVLEGGTISVGQELTLIPRDRQRPYDAAIITLSDKGSRGDRVDTSGPVIAARLKDAGFVIVEELLLPDGITPLQHELCRLVDQRQVDLIMTTGGTGFSPRDMTPEATLAVADRMAPGISEAIRAASLAITPKAMLSRAVSVIRKQTLIINVPGSPKACAESLDVIMDVLPHGLDILRGTASECSR